jgi:hypothetical protein
MTAKVFRSTSAGELENQLNEFLHGASKPKEVKFITQSEGSMRDRTVIILYEE